MIELLNKKDLLKTKKKTYKKDNIIFNENDICSEIGIVVDGEVVIKTYTNDGYEIVFNTIKKDGMFGNNLIFTKNRRYKGDVIANSDTQILFINKANLLTLLKNNDAFLINYLQKEATTTKDLNNRVKLLSLNSPKSRFLFYLESNNGLIKYSSITSLAKELNIQRETLSRLISKLTKDKIITRKNNEIRKII